MSTATGTDRGLVVRMVLTLAVVAALPVVFLYGLLTVPFAVLSLLGRHQGAVVPAISPLVVGGVAAAALVIQYLVGPSLALRLGHARPADEEEYPRLHASVGRIAQQLDIPKPAVRVVDSRAPNAFAVGRTPSNASIAVTDGLLDTLDDEELDAAVAHELAHVRNRDAALMSVAFLVPTVAFFVAKLVSTVFNGLGHVWIIPGDDDSGGVLVAIAAIILSLLLMGVLAVVFWAAGFLSYRLLSRYREYAADRAAAEATGNPGALVSALTTIENGMERAPERDLRELDGGESALYIVPLSAEMVEEKSLVSPKVFPSSHPPTKERIERLRELV
ncbi:M48 family metalloprotease [Haloarchaeobius sp. HME9146]|uniref:M48 family metalloprotease n=1 Tax=Haloarchaeobius sp. HME9146 TaxID=2978732 RepID=UPI0021BF51D5|nr:M48 family metalloprotease [Haloarchaeobius sp. HME9146]MCT9096644.1 M48 family metalloprotease [Haloarchaeobius sp. HME9146]